MLRAHASVAAATAALFLLASVVVPAVSASAADPAALRNLKSASVTDAVPGQSFNWVDEVGCSVLTDECVNAVFTDPIPSEFVIGNASTILITGAIDPSQYTITVVNQLVTVHFNQPLTSPAGATGLHNGTVTITMPVTVRSDLDASTSHPVTNTSSIVADNAPVLTASASVNLTVPLVLASKTSKSFAPATNITSAGVPTTLTLGGANAANAAVDTLVVQDPVTPTPGDIFGTTLVVTGELGTVTWPTGATSATVALWDSTTSSWVSAAPVVVGGTLVYPAAVTLANIRGVRITFTSGSPAAIPRDASTSFAVSLKNRPGLVASSVSNVAQSTVALGAASASSTATKTYTLTSASTTVAAGKSITPTRLSTVAYGSSDLTTGIVALTATNSGSVPLKLLSISEPSDPTSLAASNPLAPAQDGGGLIFSGFTAGVAWPAGATGVSVTYYYFDGTNSSATGTTTDAIPAPIAGRVTGFLVTFTGSMAQSVVAKTPYKITANPAQVAPYLSVEYFNTITVNGTSVFDVAAPPASATATVTVLADQLTVSTTKTSSATDLIAAAGQTTLVTLKSTIAAYPDSTRAANQVEIVDPSVETGLNKWYTYFNATGITAVQDPVGSTLTVQYRDSAGTYADIPGFTELPSSIYTQAFPSGLLDSIYGVKFIWKSLTGFVPGSSLTANLQYALRSTLRDTTTSLPNADVLDGSIANCSASTVSANGGSIVSNRAVSSCLSVKLHATTGGGGGADLISKNFIITGSAETAQDIIITRNLNTTRTRLSWSTAGYTNVNSMVIYDGPTDGTGAPDPTQWQKGMFDAFTLQSIPSITAGLDPLGAYDQLAIEVYNRTTGLWEAVAVGSGPVCSVATPCAIPQTARTLNAAQQGTTVAIRFTFAEKPGRVAGGSGPAPGSGVAASFLHNRRIDLIWQLRNTLRSDATIPVVNGYRYNVDIPVTAPPTHQSNILNNTQATAMLASSTLIGTASDTIALQDPNLAVNAMKSWAGGPLPIADPSTPISAPAPTGRVTITGVNQTVSAVQGMTLAEPNPSAATPNDNPFDTFDLKGFVSFTNPAGTSGLVITVKRTVGGDLSTTSTATALAWTSVQLANATSFQVAYTGASSGATATVVFDLALRRALRSDSTVAVSAGTVYNSSQAGIADLRYDPASSSTAPEFILTSLPKPAGASIELFASAISVTAGKTFTPATQTEPVRTAVKIDLTATPGGSERVVNLTITDDRASFWNTFDYVGISGAMTLPVFAPNITASQSVIRPEFCVGRVLTSVDVNTNPAAACTDATGTGTAGHWVVGGGVANASFETQATLTASGFILPTGVTALQVSGLRFTIKRLDGSQWENPQAPTLDVPISMQRRVSRHTGGTVLTDYTGNAAGPGETAAGATTNSVTADIVGAFGKTGTSTATALYKFLHAPSGIEVHKTPAGAKAPGQIFNYQLSVKNTGSWPIVNPVITDVLPTDGDGAMLIFDPDHATVYTFALTGAAPSPANGPALPNGTSGATVAVVTAGPGPSKITFTFPTSSVLEVGQNFVITIPMEFRPGLVYATAVTNTFGISGDRSLDTCTAPAGSTATYDTATNQCMTGTTVVPAEQPSLRAFISTKAIVDAPAGFPDQGFSGGTIPGCTAAEVGGFSRLPCVPLTLPGQQEVWRLTAQNTGTTSMPRLVLATRLPAVGDKTILDGFLRQSAWDAGFNGTILASIGMPGAGFTAYYTTAATACDAVLRNPSNLAACPSDPSTGWAPLTPNVDPSTVTGLQFIIDFDPAHYFLPADSLTIDVTTTTAALSSKPGPDTIANNSLSASALSITGGTKSKVTALDYSEVSIGLATGSVLLDKAMTGPGVSFVPAGQTFTGQLVCTSLGQTTSRNFTFTWNGTVMVPAVAQFDDLPGGARCTVTETPASGQTGYTANTVTVDPLAVPAHLPQVHLVNNYQLAGLTINKIVTSTAGTIPTSFHFTAVCTFLGAAITLTAADANFTLNAPGSHTITGLPVNAKCTITEDNAQGAQSTVLTGNTGTGGSANFTDETRTAVFVLGQDPNLATDGTSANNVQYDNRFDSPAVLSIQKSFAGDAATQFGSTQTSFTVHVLCTFGSTSPVQYNADVVLYQNQGFKATISNLIAGSTCTVTEPDLQHADAVVITPNDGVAHAVGTVTIPDTSTTVAVDVTNWFLTGSLQVTKVFAGDQGAIDKYSAAPTVFEFTLACTLRGADVTIPGGATRSVTAALPIADYTGLAGGAACILSEAGTGGASSWRVTDSAGNTITGGAFTVAVMVPANTDNLTADDQPQAPLHVENTYHWASVSATKTVNSALVDRSGAPLDFGKFTFTLTCTLDGVPISPKENASLQVAGGGTVTWTELEEGADCTVSETDARGATSTSYALMTPMGPSASTPGTTATLVPLRNTTNETPNLVAFTNSYDPASLTITKNVTTSAAVIPTAFHLTVTCTFLGDKLALAATDAAFQLDATQSHTIRGLPTGADCLVTEDNARGADSTVVTGTTDSARGGSVTLDDNARTAEFILSADTAVTGAITNTTNFQNLFAAPAQVSIQKNFAGAAAAQFGESQTSFTVHVYCTFDGTTPVQFDGDVVLAKDQGWKATLVNIIAGSVCTITEPNHQGADAVVITPNNETNTAIGVVTVPATPTVVEVAVTNWYLTGSLAITKTFAGDDAAVQKFGIDSGAKFTFSVACVRDGQNVAIPGGNLKTVTGKDPVANFTGIASGALCTISETATGGAVSSRILDHLGNPLVANQVTITVQPTILSADDQVQSPLSIENTFEFAEVSATKTVSESTSVDHGSFGLTLSCMLGGSPIEALEPATQKVAAGATVTWTKLAQGANCSLAETDARGATKTAYALTTPSGTPGTPTSGRTVVLEPLRGLDDIAKNHVEFVNTYSLAFTGGVVDARIVFVPLLLLFAGGAFMGVMYLRRRPGAKHAE